MALRFSVCALCLAALAVVVLLPGLPGGFLLDDGFNIVSNRILYLDTLAVEPLIYAALSFHDGIGSRALPMLSFALDYWRAGSMDPATFKATNIAIHAVTAVVLAFFLRRLFVLAQWPARRAAWGALWVALLWAMHPLQVSSVLYVVQRMQTLASLFILLALWAYLLMRQQQLAGGRGRWPGVWVVLLWLLALACKEDAVLLPVYTLALELTVLRFAAGQTVVARGLRQSYGVMVGLGVLLFVFYALPRYWSWEAYPGRDFSSLERLLTQGRVLVMYLQQILLPWPDWMPFFYDTYEVSRSLWQPWTTAPALLVLAALLALAWQLRHHRPLLAFGIVFFFAGHALSSNIIGLELVFEHRNHLPLLGVLLALADAGLWLVSRFQLPKRVWAIGMVCGCVLLAAATLVRAHSWGEPVRLGETLVRLTPKSTRAWTSLGNAWFDRYTKTKDRLYLQQAADVVEQGFAQTTSITMAGNLLLYKAILGSLQPADWQRFYAALGRRSFGWQRAEAISLLMKNADKGFIQDKPRVVQALRIVLEQDAPDAQQAVRMGIYAYKAGLQVEAMPFFRRAADLAETDDPALNHVIEELAKQGHAEWADALQQQHAKQTGKKK